MLYKFGKDMCASASVLLQHERERLCLRCCCAAMPTRRCRAWLAPCCCAAAGEVTLQISLFLLSALRACNSKAVKAGSSGRCFAFLHRWTQIWEGQLSEQVCRPPVSIPAADADMQQGQHWQGDDDVVDEVEDIL